MPADNTYPPGRVYRDQAGNLHTTTGSVIVDSGGVLDASAGTLTLAAQQIAGASLANGAVGNAQLAAGAVQAGSLLMPTAPNGFQGVGMRVARADYSFASQGGAVGTIALTGTLGIPANALVLGGALRVTTVPTSGGAATMALQIESAGDTIAAAAISGAPWSTTGLKSLVEAFSGATAVLTTAARDISLVVGTAALTAGAFTVIVFYVTIA